MRAAASFLVTLHFGFAGVALSETSPHCDAEIEKSGMTKEWGTSLIQVRKGQFAKGIGTIATNNSHHQKGDDDNDHHKHMHRHHHHHHHHRHPMDSGGPKRSNVPFTGETLENLHDQEGSIFPSGVSHFAAAHLWSSFLLGKSHDMTKKKLTELFSGFCAVSANPVEGADDMRYRLTLDKVGGGTFRGYTYYCCWPCLCDMKDFVKVDTKTVTLKHGNTHKYHFLVYGDPCKHPEKLSEHFHDPFAHSTTLKKSAPAVRCSDGKLEGATKSDHGYVILSMFFEDDDSVTAYDEADYKSKCESRVETGYDSGPGVIFRKLASITPV